MYLTKSQFTKVELELGACQNADIHALPIRMERNDVESKVLTLFKTILTVFSMKENLLPDRGFLA